MLCLTRNVGQSILIGDNIRVVVNKINTRGEQISHCSVSLAIEAPRDVFIVREEIHETEKTAKKLERMRKV